MKINKSMHFERMTPFFSDINKTCCHFESRSKTTIKNYLLAAFSCFQSSSMFCTQQRKTFFQNVQCFTYFHVILRSFYNFTQINSKKLLQERNLFLPHLEIPFFAPGLITKKAQATSLKFLSVSKRLKNGASNSIFKTFQHDSVCLHLSML